jgi:tRNA(Ile)-lysidine synthase
MPPSRTVDGVLLLRPLLAIGREQTRAACAALGLAPWDDPHNADPAYTRSRVRTTAVPALIAALGPDVVANLARTARLLAADNAVLDDLAARFGPAGDALDVNQLLTQPEAIRTRILRRWVLDSGVPPGALASRHLDAIDALITRWHGQGTVSLPGGVGVTRRGNSLMIGGN